MANIRKKHSPEFKLRAVLEILKGDKTASQLGGELGVHPMMLSNWKKHFLEHGPEIFEKSARSLRQSQHQKQEEELFEQIGRLKMENEWLKKKFKAIA